MPASLQVALHNDSTTDQLWAYITGIALQHEGKRCILKPDGKSLYFPQEPPAIGTPLAEDCAIPLGAPGNTVTVTIPQIAGGRIWIARGKKLTFLLNPGPALVEPSVLNPSDPNADVDFAFAEFTLNDAQLYANISYVDMAPALPIAISLKESNGTQQDVAGMTADGIEKLAADLRKQENDACDREEHLATLLEQAREIRARAIQDRSNGLVIIRDRKKKLEDLEKRIFNNEEIDPDELVGLVGPLKLEEPVERAEFERMRVEGRGEELEDGYESDPFGRV